MVLTRTYVAASPLDMYFYLFLDMYFFTNHKIIKIILKTYGAFFFINIKLLELTDGHFKIRGPKLNLIFNIH